MVAVTNSMLKRVNWATSSTTCGFCSVLEVASKRPGGSVGDSVARCGEGCSSSQWARVWSWAVPLSRKFVRLLWLEMVHAGAFFSINLGFHVGEVVNT